MFGDNFFKRVENKTNVDKNTIMSLAKKIQNSDMKDEKTLREVVQEISQMTGKEVTKEKEDKIVNAIIKDNIPQNIDKMF
ncbi:MAG TPA: stage VI sporulation protein F [Candidatus Faecimonas gallistercoris]|nr:stage VI sporulation protein F [Candidatus Faecimonas gallistercoris]